MEDYPTEGDLEKIKNWSYEDGFAGLVELVCDIWAYGDDGYSLKDGRKHGTNHRVKKLELHTLGWSGNEDIIAALKRNILFWSLCLYQYTTGGHYLFEIENWAWRGKNK